LESRLWLKQCMLGTAWGMAIIQLTQLRASAYVCHRVATKVLLSLKVEHPQKVLWIVAFLLIFGE